MNIRLPSWLLIGLQFEHDPIRNPTRILYVVKIDQEPAPCSTQHGNVRFLVTDVEVNQHTMARSFAFSYSCSLTTSFLIVEQDDPGYYDPPGGLLSYDLHVDEFIEPASHLDTESTSQPITLEGFYPHFNLVNAQLVQVSFWAQWTGTFL